jgi:hypothetical protein
MKTVKMLRSFDYWIDRRCVHFSAGAVYSDVIEAAVKQIVMARAGSVTDDATDAVSARHAFMFIAKSKPKGDNHG